MTNKILKAKAILAEFHAWKCMFKIIASNLFSILKSPSFIIFSFVAIGLSTMGIWIAFYPNGVDSTKRIVEQLDGLAVFTFCIATLGGMAAEYFFEEKDKDTGTGINLEKTQSRHLAFFMWAVATLLAFFALKNKEMIIYGISATLLLWMFVNIHRPKFQAINKAAVDNLSADYEENDSNEESSDEIKGAGL